MKIDIYAHVIPPKLNNTLVNNGAIAKGTLGTSTESYLTLYDLNERFRIMDKYPDLVQVLTLSGVATKGKVGLVGIDDVAGKQGAIDLAKTVNDEMAELVYKYPDRFVAAVAVLPMSNIDAALIELDRAINELKLKGILMRIPINGKSVDSAEFMPLYEKMCHYNLPIWWHPERSPNIPDYADEGESKHFIWHMWGLPIETTKSMTRLVFSGVLERYPDLKIITHHCGGMIPYFAQRLASHYSEMRDKTKNFKQGLTEPHIEYFRRFYADTAIMGNTSALMCAYEFFGIEHLLFGTDMPFDPQLGDYSIRNTIQAIEHMSIPDIDKKKIFEDNARRLLRLDI